MDDSWDGENESVSAKDELALCCVDECLRGPKGGIYVLCWLFTVGMYTQCAS